MEVTQPLVARAAMLIRRPALDCYEAFVDPAITSKFWFSAGSDRLDAGRQVIWTWGMYGVSSTIDVKELVPGHKIVIDWDAGTEPATRSSSTGMPAPNMPASSNGCSCHGPALLSSTSGTTALPESPTSRCNNWSIAPMASRSSSQGPRPGWSTVSS